MQKNRKVVFCIDGEVLEDDSLLHIKNNVTDDEWERIVCGTVKYYCFAKMLKSIGMPLLQEEWDKRDERFLRQLKRSVALMRKIDGLCVAKFDIKEICDVYAGQMLKGVHEIKELMKSVTGRTVGGNDRIRVSDL